MAQNYHHGALRQALLTAAEKILDEQGIAALTLRAAARAAEVSHAAPAHHFGDLTGLLSALAAAGFERFRAFLQASVSAAGPERRARLLALGAGYVAFAQNYPGLFQLMFRSERLDWSNPALQEAGEAAFALLTQDDADIPEGMGRLVVAMSRWSLVHGMATLIIDGRVAPMVAKVPGAGVEQLIEAVLEKFTG